MRGFIVWIAFTALAFVIPFLPFPPGGKLLVASIYGGVVGWGIMRWKNR
jgi:hypothetical protein